MKDNKMLFIITGISTGSLLIISLILVLTNLVKTWRLLWVVSGIVGLTWLVIFVIYFMKLTSTIDTKTNKISDKDAIINYENEVFESNDNPDNLIRQKVGVFRLGAKEKNSILVAEFYGTEKNQRRFLIQNLDNKEIKHDLIDPTEEKILEAMNLSPETPSEIITEKIRQKFEFGQPVTEREITKPNKEETIEDKKQI